MKARLTVLLFLVTATLGLTDLAAARRRAATSPALITFCSTGVDVAGVTVPDGFCIRKFADVPTPRTLYFAPNGDLLVASPKRSTPGGAPPGAGAIFLFRQTDVTLPPVRYTFAASAAMESVHGLAIAGDRLYYTLAESVQSAVYAAGDTTIGPSESIADLSGNGYDRWTHPLVIGTDGSIYTSRGQFDNDACPLQDRRVGAILRVGAGSEFRGTIIAEGMRDPLYMRCLPWGRCYAAELSGDAWENLGGTEKLIEVHQGDTFGYPCCIDRDLPNPLIVPSPDCSRVAPVKQNYPLHDTPFGFDWERSGKWPAPFSGGFFVGLHGHFGSWDGTGLQWAPVDPESHVPTRTTVDFATGFGRSGAISRVTDVIFAPDGRLFFCDDQGSAIYWIAPRTLAK